MRDQGDSTNIAWLAVTGPVSGTYTVTATPGTTNEDAIEGSAIQYKLKTTLTGFSAPAVYSTITITIGVTTCNCELLTWNAAPAATAQTLAVLSPATSTTVNLNTCSYNVASETASPPIRKCTGGSVCAKTSTYTLTATKNGTAASWPAFMLQTTTTNTIVVTPAGPTDVGVWVVHVVQNTASGPNPSYDAITITVPCVITALTNPTAPSLADRTYNIWSPKKLIDMSAVAYATYA